MSEYASASSVAFTLRDLLLLTYAVPAERVRPHVPAGLDLDMLPDAEGGRAAFIQMLCAYHEKARWSLLPEKIGQSFHQLTYRVLTRREGRRGTFTLRTYASTDEGRAAQRALSRDADFARFAIQIIGNPATGTYRSYNLRAIGDQGQTEVEARPIETGDDVGDGPDKAPFPWTDWDAAATFLADRPDNYFRASAPRTGVGLLPLRYGALPAPTVAKLAASPRLSVWTKLNLLSVEAMAAPHSVLLLPSVAVASFPPRFARLNG